MVHATQTIAPALGTSRARALTGNAHNVNYCFTTTHEGKMLKQSVISTFAATLLVCGAAYAGARDDATVIMPDNPNQLKTWESWGFSDAIVTGDTVYLSGVVAGTKPGDKNLEDAYARAFERIGAILKKAGVSWDDVVDITTFHTDLKTQMPAIVAVKNKYVRAPFPAWTAIQIVRLIPDNGITEIKLVAKRPSGLVPAAHK
jgi:enamine deaminase RidA (YjgF/YER057c/UK114 family)